jgi:hypothetical protein
MAFLQCGGAGTKVIPVCEAFAAVCKAQAEGSKYAYLLLPGLKLNHMHRPGGLSKCIEDEAKKAYADGKQGLVLLTGVRGGVGLDVKEVGPT